MLVPKLSNIFVYSCGGKYSKNNLKNFIKHIKINPIVGNYEWVGYRNKKGYGIFGFHRNGKSFVCGAHRVAYEMFTGQIIPENICVCHKNDITFDVNPSHLFLGTNRDNIEDKISKGRQDCKRYEEHNLVKLTWLKVNEIRKLYSTGEYTQRQLSKMFNITHGNIHKIVSNSLWYDKNYIPIKIVNHRNKNKINNTGIAA